MGYFTGNDNENFAQRARRDSSFIDFRAERKKEKEPTGGEVEKTYYSDGSSRVHWGGPTGPQDYDEFGEEC